MATTTHTRRRIIAAMGALPIAALAVPALAQAPSIAAPDRRRFDRRLATYRRHFAEQEAFHAAHVHPICAEFDRRYPEGGRESPEAEAMIGQCFAAESRFDAFVSRTGESLALLLFTPAPDHRALATKIEIAVREDAFDLVGAKAFGAALLADVRRLNGAS